mmetsp:Transcript_20440/g.26353  ORF Transcript_20440/g.26353 Transcript_20440/m.26353 type:complete len:200 (-) Transcript_20440:29-628(-)|eukprot:CAMPEP_0198138248 /NCGR_PEP_ID=MMETSP1443-20131203/1664_1 /TAXON_ID=186043 /ORGANISM="Entomoneis sp., Strain CCMP2396" /LENGTH=199 /DNA_ID=CAMNT_0043799949 /DNA_START=92 /DNA_END=691 /DNA_ORIENTATION=-
MKIASHAFPSLAALLVLLTLIPASVAKLGDESPRNVAPEEHDDKLDRQLANTTSDHHHEDDDFEITFSLTMEITDDSEHFDRMLLKMLPIEWEDNWLETFGDSVDFTFEFEDSSDRNLETVKRRNLRLRRPRRLRVNTRCNAGGGRQCSLKRFDCPGQKGRQGCRRALVEGEDLVTSMQQFGDEMSKLFVSIENVNVTV